MTETIDPKLCMPLSIKKPEGAYCLGTKDCGYLEIGISEKPLWIHRFFVRLILGWRWIDYPKEDEVYDDWQKSDRGASIFSFTRHDNSALGR